MNDEQRLVVRLLREYDGIETWHTRKDNELKAAELITHLSDELDRVLAENEHIRQTHVTHEAYKMVLDELEQVKRELKALLKIIDESMCDDEKCKICTHYQPNNADADCVVMHYIDDGNTLDGECKFEWRGVCDENGGEDDV